MRKSLLVVRGGIVLGLFAVAASGCSGFGEEEGEGSTQPARTPEENAAPPPPGPVDGKPIVGIYVSASQGKPGASGIPGSPVPTIKEGLAIAKREGLPVIVCAEEYAENVELLDGVSAYGYYDCSVPLWVRGPKRAIVRAPASPAVIGRNIGKPTRLEGFEVLAPDLDGAVAKDREGTSIALDVRASKGVLISESLLRGGKGAKGTDGTAAPSNDYQGVRNGKGGASQGPYACVNPATCPLLTKVTGPTGASITCTVGPAPGPGGAGGDASIWYYGTPQGDPAAVDTRGKPFAATTATAMGGGARIAGNNGSPGPDGVNGTNGVWRFDLEGFVIGDGTPGGDATPGMGGGGGGGTYDCFTAGGAISCQASGASGGYAGYYQTATGGSGGAGGCPGLPGTPGTGGGASIGALLITAEVQFARSTIESSHGGTAGKGTLGTGGLLGGAGGAAGNYSGKGGDGGAGGAGGASGHGAPGPSIAVVFSGAKPVYDTETKRVPGQAGAGQPELSALTPTGTKTLPAINGISKEEHEFTP